MTRIWQIHVNRSETQNSEKHVFQHGDLDLLPMTFTFRLLWDIEKINSHAKLWISNGTAVRALTDNKGTTINDLGGARRKSRKKKFSRPFSGKKKILEATLREKKISGSPTPRKKISRISLLREKKKFWGSFLIGLYKGKKIFGVHLWEKKILGKPPRRKKKIWGSRLSEKKFYGTLPWKKKIISRKHFRGKKNFSSKSSSGPPPPRSLMVVP